MLGSMRYMATIPAKDLEGTRTFYEETLGLKAKSENAGGITYEAGGIEFQLYKTQFAGTAQHTLGGFEVEDVRTAVEELRSRGVVFEEYDFPGLKTVDGIAEIEGEVGAWFKDPEGNILALYHPTTES